MIPSAGTSSAVPTLIFAPRPDIRFVPPPHIVLSKAGDFPRRPLAVGQPMTCSFPADVLCHHHVARRDPVRRRMMSDPATTKHGRIGRPATQHLWALSRSERLKATTRVINRLQPPVS